MFFDSWSDLLRVFVVGAPAYAVLVVLLRISGKRTLSKMNAFDFVITVAMGSTLATVLLSPEVSFVEGIAALGLLVLLQYVVTWASVRSRTVHRLVKSEPVLVFHDARFLQTAMRRERITRDELLAAARSQGHADVDSIGSMVLETDGSVTVVPRVDGTARSTLDSVRRGRGSA